MGSSNMATEITPAHYASYFVIGKIDVTFQLEQLNDHLFGNGLFIRVTVGVFHERLSICMCVSYPFGFEGGMWDVIAPDHCLSFYFLTSSYASF